MPMVGGVPGLPPPNMPGHLGNIPTYDPDTCCTGIFVPLTVGSLSVGPWVLGGCSMIHQSWACSHMIPACLVTVSSDHPLLEYSDVSGTTTALAGV
jgi:hypothetical protein